jgi:hypothetical protein
MSLFNAHYDECCFLPIHVYDTATARPVALLLRPGAPPSGAEIRNHLRRLIRRIRQHWPNTRLTIRGDGHYGRPEVMAWCEANAVSYCQRRLNIPQKWRLEIPHFVALGVRF